MYTLVKKSITTEPIPLYIMVPQPFNGFSITIHYNTHYTGRQTLYLMVLIFHYISPAQLYCIKNKSKSVVRTTSSGATPPIMLRTGEGEHRPMPRGTPTRRDEHRRDETSIAETRRAPPKRDEPRRDETSTAETRRAPPRRDETSTAEHRRYETRRAPPRRDGLQHPPPTRPRGYFPATRTLRPHPWGPRDGAGGLRAS